MWEYIFKYLTLFIQKCNIVIVQYMLKCNNFNDLQGTLARTHGNHYGMCETIFSSKPLLKASNHTFITLIHKTPNASELNEFRPIACVNMIYKLLTNIMATKIGHVTNELIYQQQVRS